MLELVNFIKTHENWEELLSTSPFSLFIKRDGKLVLFRYNQIESDFSQPICREARGIILEEGTWRVVRYALRKFFNIDEPFADKLDWYSAIATEKIDGSLMTLFFYDGEWRLATNGSIDAYKTTLPNPIEHKTFGELFDVAAQRSGLDYSRLNPDCCYTFELVSPLENKVVLSYPEPALYHLSTRYLGEDWENTEFEEIEVNIGVRKPKVYALNTEEEYRQCVADMPEGHEGIVIRDAFYRRVKVKTPLYFELHRMSNNGILNAERAVDLIRANDYEEFLSYFPEHRPYFESVKRVLDEIPYTLADIQMKVDGWKSRNQMESESIRRRQFAQEFSIYQLKALYFKAYDGRLYAFVDGMTTKQFIKMFGLEEVK